MAAASPQHPLLVAQAHLQAGRFVQAEQAARRVLQRDGRDADALFVLGLALREQGQWEQACHFLERAVRVRATVESLVAWGGVCERVGRFNEAQESFLRAIELDPAHEFARLHLADSLLMMGRPEEAVRAAEQTVAAAPGNFLHRATRATFMCYASDRTPAERMAAHVDVALAVERVPRPAIPAVTGASHEPDPERPLRVAYLSPDFLMHSVSYFFEPIVEHGSREFVPHCYFASQTSDATTERLKAHVRARAAAAVGGARGAGDVVTWRDLPRPNEAQVARLLREDRIDIAVDLAGYTGSSILWALRQRVVPVQVTYLGYPHSTAMPNIDYRVVDSKTDPQGAASTLASEQLVRLDPSFLCYRVPTDPPPPPVAPLACAASAGSPITFGSFNLLGKVSAATRRTWARVLDTVPGSRLVLKDGTFGWPQGRERYARTLAEAGIDPARVEMLGKTKSRNEHLALYARVDVALDPFPYNGTTTTCEALMMGVPVVTLAGQGHCARVGDSILRTVGLEEWIAGSEAEYVAIAARVAADRPGLAALRAGLRERLRSSALCDGPGFVRRWEGALRQMWRTWCASAGGTDERKA
ncbi:MAG: CDC27 family protein [Phycisphaerales bacterium]